MTSKEVEKMKNEEVLEILLGNVDYKDYSSETMRLVNSCVSRLWEILDRLEALENNSNKVIKDSVKLINKNLELQKENEKLKKAIDIALKYDVSLESIKRLSYDDYIELCIMFNEKYPTQQEYDLIKEVLGQ